MTESPPYTFRSRLRAQLEALPPHAHIDLTIEDASSWISARPVYCDRGRFLWSVESTNTRRLTIDSADGFPRYYFTVDAAVLEICAWLDARKLIATIAGSLSHRGKS